MSANKPHWGRTDNLAWLASILCWASLALFLLFSHSFRCFCRELFRLLGKVF